MSADRGSAAARRRRSVVLLIALIGFAALIYLITVARLGAGVSAG